MGLYTPRTYAAEAPEAALALLQAHPFATLITSAASQEPQVSHIPLRHEAGPGLGSLRGHVARANPHWQRFAEGYTVAVFHGPHAYVSPSWYAEPEGQVPTWNYAVVHVHGRPELLDATESRLHLLELARAFEGPGWQLGEDRMGQMLQGIVGFRMPIQRVETKFKMSQNKSARDRRGVIAGLRSSTAAESHATAAWMEAHERD